MLLGGSWVVISGVISPLILVISIVTLRITPIITKLNPKHCRTLKGTLITPLITAHEPPSTGHGLGWACVVKSTFDMDSSLN